jgi:ribosome-binding factor A
LAILLQRKVADPRLVGLNVTGVEVDRELAYATIYVTAEAEEQEVLSALESARGYLRRELAAEIPMRSFPQLRFRWDYSPDRGARVDELLDRLQQERDAKSNGSSIEGSPPNEGGREIDTDDS